MEREEAKHILQLCRAGNDEDRLDPLIAEALGMCDSDSELRAWFEEKQAIDTRISAALSTIEPLPDFKTATLIGMRAHHAQATIELSSPRPRSTAQHWLKPWSPWHVR